MGDKSSERYIVAFEIGSSKIRGAVGVVDNSGVVDIVATEEEKLTDKVRYGCIQNVEVSNALGRVVDRLEAYPRVDPREITGAYVALGGRSLQIKQVDVSISLPAEIEITRPLINDLMQQRPPQSAATAMWLMLCRCGSLSTTKPRIIPSGHMASTWGHA